MTIIIEFLKGESFDEIKRVLESLTKLNPKYSFHLLGVSYWKKGETPYIAFEGSQGFYIVKKKKKKAKT